MSQGRGHRREDRDPRRRPGHRLPAGDVAALRRPGHHARLRLDRRGHPELAATSRPRPSWRRSTSTRRSSCGTRPPTRRSRPSRTSKPLGVKVRYFDGAAYMDYLIQSGQLDKGQTDGSYDGTPANFVAAGGKDAQQGFASAEPYFYEKVLKDWGKPIAYQLIHDAGWTAVRAVAGRDAGQLREVPRTASRSWCRSSSSPRSTTSTDPAEADALILDLVNAVQQRLAVRRGPGQGVGRAAARRTSWWPTAPTARWAASTWTG